MFNSEAFVLAFAISVMSYIGLLMYQSYKEVTNRDEER